MVWRFLDGANFVQNAVKLNALLVPLFLTLSPSRAQNQTEIPAPFHDLLSVQTRNFSSRAAFSPTSPSITSNLVINAAPLFSTLALPDHPPSAPSADIARKRILPLPTTSCFSPNQGDLLSGCAIFSPATFTISAANFNPYPSESILHAPDHTEKFHWKTAIWQSFGFLVVGHAFRLANDPGARYLLLHKPFWHDYWASADDFHMSRWGDGDSFLVNYIDHPMEGAVAGNIFLNNDPKGRSVRFGKSSSYWYSRLKVMAWAAAFEAYFEIGPIFSEAAIGNEGGFTYVPGCGDYPCDKYPDKHFKPLTNNTGWVDFVITPTVGMGWIVLEDAIEREFVDRLAKGSPAPKYKILRGSLAPSHTFANMFAGKKPWFRYFEEGSFIQNFGGPLNHTDEHPLWKEEPRYSLGVEFITLNLPLDSSSCSNCKHFFPGYGFDFNYRFAKYAYFDSVVNLFPSSGSNSQHGGAQESLAGLKLGRNLGNCGFFFQSPQRLHPLRQNSILRQFLLIRQHMALRS
jgi:hypothetical protein